MIERLCKNCSTAFKQYNTTQSLCPRCTYNRYAKPRKPIRKIGKVAKKWVETRHEWIKQNPPPWACYLCGKALTMDTLTLDHIEPRSRRPDLRYVFHNLAPCCMTCNTKKGSISLDKLKT